MRILSTERIEELSDIQSESGVIGTLIHHPEYVLHSDYLTASSFYNTENACVYWAIQDLYKEGISNIDAYNVSSKLQSHPGVYKAVEKYNLPSVQEFMELYSSVARHSLEEYTMLAENIVTLAFKRDLVKVLNQASRDCYKKDYDLNKLNGSVYDKLDELTQKYITTAEIHTLGSEIDSIWDEITNRRVEGGIYGIPSKYPCFNNYFTFERGELVVVQAKYKRGKSILLLNEVVHKLKNGVPTLVIDTEMQTRSYTERLLSHLTGVPAKKIKSGQYTEAEAEKISESIEWLREQPFVHIYNPKMTNEEMYSICKMLKHKMGLSFVVYDIMKSNELTSSENYNLLGVLSNFLKNRIAGELDMAVLASCHLNRQGEVADSNKINNYLSIGIKWDIKTQEMIAKDGIECGNAFAKIYVSRNGEQMQEDDEDDYLDFVFSGATMTISEAEQHKKDDTF